MLETLHILATQSVPEVVLDNEKSIFTMKGDILPEDSIDFFNPIFNWFNEYSQNPKDYTVFEIDISIMNTSSTRRMVTLFKIFEKIISEKHKVEVKWIYLSDDEIMQFAAYEFSNAFKKIKFITHAK